MTIYCHECGSTNVRIAHFRFGDLIRLLAFRYPVRCRTCKARWHAPVRYAIHLPRPQHGRGRDRKPV
jgi:hypothetical protein